MREAFRKGLSIKDRLLFRVRGRTVSVKTPSYREVYIDQGPEHPIALKQIYKNDVLIGERGLAVPLFKKRFLEEEYAPSFAEGRCRIIGGGDYKTVVADKDGKSDKVIKIYNWHEYRGQGAQRRAEAAAKKIKAIHEVAGKIAPGYLLPSRFGVDYKNGVYQVVEIQQRAETIPIEFFDPETYERLDAEATDIAINKSGLVEEELLRRGLSRRDLFTGIITDDISLTEIHWDLITNHLVSLDFVDQVDIGDYNSFVPQP